MRKNSPRLLKAEKVLEKASKGLVKKRLISVAAVKRKNNGGEQFSAHPRRKRGLVVGMIYVEGRAHFPYFLSLSDQLISCWRRHPSVFGQYR